LIGELLPLRFRPGELRLGRLQCSLGNPPLGPHRGLSREQFGQRGFGFPRGGFGNAELASDSR
jgi:hypothetical protein